MFRRFIYHGVIQRMREPRRFLQVLSGPRQAGKTTLAQQIMEELEIKSIYASADLPSLKDSVWIEQQWEAARLETLHRKSECLLVLDEVQKVPQWSEVVKKLWDEDTRSGLPLKILLLGSSPLLTQKGLTDSLAGRFEIIRVTHWSFLEMHEAFGLSLDEYIYYGGYPGSAQLLQEPARWQNYILDSLVETTISRDILLLWRVDKPALLRRLFELACIYSGQILSYQKMLGQLHDAGNTTTLAHYLELLRGAGMVTGLPKFTGSKVRQRGSSPKLQVFNTALVSTHSHCGFREFRSDPERWGRLVESAVGAHLLNRIQGTDMQLFYWREKNREVDFVLKKGSSVVAFEVKSGRRPMALSGMKAFAREFAPTRNLLVGTGGIALEEFFTRPVTYWFG